MSTSTPPDTVPKVRTYAADLNFARTKKQSANPITVVTEVKAQTGVSPVASDTTLEGVIPPFHTFDKPHKITEVAQTEAKVAPAGVSQSETQKILTRSSHLSAESASKENLPAVIITDTKRKRFKLSTAIVASLTDWWTTKQEVAKKKKVPRYTVPVAERRKGVIQKATAKTGRTSTADHTAVVSRIKATKQISHTPNPALPTTPPKENENLTWETAIPVASTQEKTTMSNYQITQKQIYPPSTSHHENEVTNKSSENWESDIQTQANALTKPAPVSAIELTGQELTKIKQQRLATLLKKPKLIEQPVVSVVPKILPRIPKIEIVPPSPVPVTIQPLPQSARVVVPEPVAYVAPVEISVTATAPSPINRPKILPIIPQPLESGFSLSPAISVAMPMVVEQPNIFQTTPAIDDIRGNQTPVPERRFAPPRETKRSIFTLFSQTNHIVFVAFGVLTFVVVSGLGIRAYLNTEGSDPTLLQTVVEPTAFYDATLKNSPTFVTGSDDIQRALGEQMSGTDSLVEISFLDQTGNQLTPPTLIEILDADLVFDFKSTITDVTMGTYRGTPWVQFTVGDKNTALGGMLDWEKNMNQDLAPIYGVGKPLSRNRFTDSIIGTTDVRILKNNDGTEEITYGFTSYNTLLITSNTSAFLNLAEKSQ